MIVPITPGMASAPGAPAQAMPSQSNLLMALTEMHKQGRFDDDDNSTPSPRKGKVLPFPRK